MPVPARAVVASILSRIMPDIPLAARCPPAELLTIQSNWLAPMRARLLRRLGIAHRTSVLDLGAGYGVVTAELARRCGGSVTAFDNALTPLISNDAAFAHARRVCGAAHTLPFAAQSFDLVFCQFALLWMQPLRPTIRDIWRVLQPGGILLAIEPDYGGLIEYPDDGVSRELWIAALTRAGADPLIGRKLPSLLEQQGFAVRVDLLPELLPPAPERFALLRGLPLTRQELHQLRRLEQRAQQTTHPWAQVVHLPFFLVTARCPDYKPQQVRV